MRGGTHQPGAGRTGCGRAVPSPPPEPTHPPSDSHSPTFAISLARPRRAHTTEKRATSTDKHGCIRIGIGIGIGIGANISETPPPQDSQSVAVGERCGSEWGAR
eukprot:545466-Rhodomonas_salina.2